MKQILLLIAITLICVSCTSDEDKAKKLIREDLFSTLNDYESYEPVEFSKLDSLFTDYTMDEIYAEANKLLEQSKEIQNQWKQQGKNYHNSSMNEAKDVITAINYDIMIYPKIIDSLKANYNSTFIGMGLIHTFRAKNAAGNYRLTGRQYVFDGEMRYILFYRDLDKESPIENHSRVKNGNEIKREIEAGKAIEYASDIEKNEQFLTENMAKDGVITLPSGLQYKIIREGKGKIPNLKSKIKVSYRSTLIDGTELDNTSNPVTFETGWVIKGFAEALQLMPVGSKWVLYIPQQLAYGADGFENKDKGIPPFSTIIIEVELLEIVK